MVDLLVAQGNPLEALTYAGRAKSRALLDTFRSGHVDITKAMTREDQEQERKRNGPNFSQHYNLPQSRQAASLKIEEAAGILPNTKSALMEFVVTEDKTYLFVMTRKMGSSRNS